MKIRALIVDDEPLARQRIRLLARDEPDLELIGECGSAADALAAIGRDLPDLLFLDVQMPEMDGFKLLQKLPRDRLPIVIFTTAYDKHAVRAFEAHALDYLLKPFDEPRVRATIERHWNGATRSTMPRWPIACKPCSTTANRAGRSGWP